MCIRQAIGSLCIRVFVDISWSQFPFLPFVAARSVQTRCRLAGTLLRASGRVLIAAQRWSFRRAVSFLRI